MRTNCATDQYIHTLCISRVNNPSNVSVCAPFCVARTEKSSCRKTVENDHRRVLGLGPWPWRQSSVRKSLSAARRYSSLLLNLLPVHTESRLEFQLITSVLGFIYRKELFHGIQGVVGISFSNARCRAAVDFATAKDAHMVNTLFIACLGPGWFMLQTWFMPVL